MVVLASLVFLGLALAEGAAGAQSGRETLTIDRGWSVRQPVMGWGPEKAAVYHAKMVDPSDNSIIYETDYTFDFDLLRHTVSASQARLSSFSAIPSPSATASRTIETLPQDFADLYRPQGARPQSRASPAQPCSNSCVKWRRVVLTRLSVRIRNCSFSSPRPFHAERTSCKAYWTAHAPLYALEDGRVVFKGDCNEGASLLVARMARQLRPLEPPDSKPWRHKLKHKDVELYVSVLEAAVKMAKEKYGVPTIIPYLRQPKEYLDGTGFTDDLIMQRLSDAGAIVIDAFLRKEAAGRRTDHHQDRRPSDALRQSRQGRTDQGRHRREIARRAAGGREVTRSFRSPHQRKWACGARASQARAAPALFPPA